jgi:integrase
MAPGDTNVGSRPITGKPDSVATLERRISALRWNFAQRGETFDRADRHVATVLAGVRRTQGRPPAQKEAILPEDLKAMIATLDLRDLRGLRDRAILLVGFAGGLRRSEIVGLDCGARQTRDGTGWTEILDDGILVTLRGKTGWREVEIGRGSSDLSCPVVALEAWLKFARIAHGPLFRRVFADGNTVDSERLADKHVARLVKRTALAAGVRGDLAEGERARKFSGHSLRAGLASAAEIDERFVQKQLGHASAEMTRRYQRRRDRFRVNLTKAAGL